jgi:hypothetical protein
MRAFTGDDRTRASRARPARYYKVQGFCSLVGLMISSGSFALELDQGRVHGPGLALWFDRERVGF